MCVRVPRTGGTTIVRRMHPSIAWNASTGFRDIAASFHVGRATTTPRSVTELGSVS